jgi:hypothetical protein
MTTMSPDEAISIVFAALDSPAERVRLTAAVYILDRARPVPEPVRE